MRIFHLNFIGPSFVLNMPEGGGDWIWQSMKLILFVIYLLNVLISANCADHYIQVILVWVIVGNFKDGRSSTKNDRDMKGLHAISWFMGDLALIEQFTIIKEIVIRISSL